MWRMAMIILFGGLSRNPESYAGSYPDVRIHIGMVEGLSWY